MVIARATITVMLATSLVLPAEGMGFMERKNIIARESLQRVGVEGTEAETWKQERFGQEKPAGNNSTKSEAIYHPTSSFLLASQDLAEIDNVKPHERQKSLIITDSQGEVNDSDESVRDPPPKESGKSGLFDRKAAIREGKPLRRKLTGNSRRNGFIDAGNEKIESDRGLGERKTTLRTDHGGGDFFGDLEGDADGLAEGYTSIPGGRGHWLASRMRMRRSPSRPHPPSPCPGVFSFLREGSSGGKWYGVVQVTTDVTRVGVRLGIQLDKPALLLGAWLGEVKTENKKDFLIQNNEKIINPDSPLPVKILVQYEENRLPPPRITKITLNGIQICPKIAGRPKVPPLNPLSHQVQGKQSNSRKSPSLGSGGQEATTHEIVDGVECGQIEPRPTLLIAHGQPTERGDWPWHAAIYESTRNNLKYICGGSVIGKKMILTAAHCVSERRGRKDLAVSPESRVVFLGKFFLKGWEEGIQTKEVDKIHVHPEYSSIGYEADIAILILSSPIEFTEYVKPVCLWDGNRPHLREIEGHEGVVVGWGFDEEGVLSESLAMATMPVVSQPDCIWSNPQFFSRYTSDRTFCAGYRNGTSACNGDSGGGMFFPKRVPGKTNEYISPLTWTIRGIVSLSVSQETRKLCDTKHYVIFADVAKYYHWIKQYR